MIDFIIIILLAYQLYRDLWRNTVIDAIVEEALGERDRLIDSLRHQVKDTLGHAREAALNAEEASKDSLIHATHAQLKAKSAEGVAQNFAETNKTLLDQVSRALTDSPSPVDSAILSSAVQKIARLTTDMRHLEQNLAENYAKREKL